MKQAGSRFAIKGPSVCYRGTPAFPLMNRKYETKFGEPFPETEALPYSPLLPRSKIGLLKWRLYVRQRSLEDLQFRETIQHLCAQDVVFFVNTFCYFHETRDVEENIGIFPVCLWPDQKDILAVFQKHVGKIEGVVDKTRGIGLSYLLTAFCLWLWLYNKHRIEIGLVSKDDTSLDLKDRPSTLMGKLDVLYEFLPAYMKISPSGEQIGYRTHTNHRFENRGNKNAIQGYTSSDNKLRSARCFTVFVDEGAFLNISDQKFLASAYGTSPSIWWVSTHNGTGTLFHRLCQDEESDLIRLSTYWQNNVKCRAGMYRSINGRIEILDANYKWPEEGYNFSHEHAPNYRSPWIDKQFRRPQIDPQVLFEELYGVAAINSRKLIQPPALLQAARQQCQIPIARGSINEFGEFVEDPFNGELYFFQDPKNPFTGIYYLGADSALGVADAAYAGLCVIDANTGLQVISAAFANCQPLNFARKVVDVAKYITGARGAGYCTVVYESTGINVGFAGELARLYWPSVYKGDGTKPGVGNNDRGLAWLSELGRAIMHREVSIRDERIIDDLDQFEIENRKFELIFTGSDGHGDLGMAAALAWWGSRKRRQSVLQKQAENRTIQNGIEAEPLFIQRKRAASAGLYSSRFLNN